MRGLILAAVAAVFSVVTPAYGSEDGLSRGFMQSRVLGADAIHWLRTAAVAAGRKDRAGKYAAGAMAVVVLPVARLDFDAMMAVLPLVCEVTIDGDPARWEAYSEVRILNRHAYAGYAYGERFGGVARCLRRPALGRARSRGTSPVPHGRVGRTDSMEICDTSRRHRVRRL